MTVSQDVARALPLVVERLAINDPMFVVSGHAWSLSIMCPWELNGPNVRVTFETDESDVAAALELLVGQSIVAVDINDDLFDAVFHFDNEFELSVLADTGLDPWSRSASGIGYVSRRRAFPRPA